MSEIMQSINFEILRPSNPILADLGGFAEQYALPDPSSALVKLRAYIETILGSLYSAYGLPRPYQPSLNDLINNQSFRDIVPTVILDKLHAIRYHGNKAAHGEPQSPEKARFLLREAFDLGCWFFITQCGGNKSECPSFQEIPALASGDMEWNVVKEKKSVLEKLAAQEARMQELLQELEVKQAAIQIAQKQAAELKSIAKAGKQAADALAFDEETTRLRLIDSMLAEAGWDVGANGTNTEYVAQEEEVQHQPTTTGIGYADYVLKDDNGLPLAVVEAKKTAKDANIGRKQAQLYADGLEKMHGQRPVIFYTNGFDVWMWDDKGGYPPRKLYGFYSKDSLQYLVNYQRDSRKQLDSVIPNPDIAGRLYQLEAIKRVGERFTRAALYQVLNGTAPIFPARQAAWDVVQAVASSSSVNDVERNLVMHGTLEMDFSVARHLALTSYVAVTWSAYDRLANVCGRLAGIAELTENPKQNPKACEDFLGKKDTLGFAAHMTIQQAYRWPLKVTYKIRNWLVHEGYEENSTPMFQGQRIADGFRLHGDAKRHLEKCCGYNADNGKIDGCCLAAAEECWPTGDVLTVLEQYHAEVDELFAGLLKWSVDSFVGQITAFSERDRPH